MADTKISALTAVTTAAGTDQVPVNQGGTTKRETLDQIATYYKTVGMPRVYNLNADHAISAITATEVTGLGAMTLEAGTYIFQMYILAQSATATVSPMFGVNFTGTAAVKNFHLRTVTTGTTAISGVADSAGATSGQIMEGVSQNAYSTTAPNMGFTGGVDTINTTILYVIDGVVIVTASGDLELWHGSETATSTTVKAGTSVLIFRCA